MSCSFYKVLLEKEEEFGNVTKQRRRNQVKKVKHSKEKDKLNISGL